MSNSNFMGVFKAKPVSGGDFVVGSLVTAADGMFIIPAGTSMMFEEPDYHQVGMGCGLEDRAIQDRYEAMQYGWEKAVEKCGEGYPELIEVDPETVIACGVEKEAYVKLLNWFLENYMGVKGATPNQVPILVDKYLRSQIEGVDGH